MYILRLECFVMASDRDSFVACLYPGSSVSLLLDCLALKVGISSLDDLEVKVVLGLA